MAKSKATEWLTPDGLLLLKGWAKRGLTDEQIASNMNIATGTLYEYKKKYSEIYEALKETKDIADMEVENALYKNAIGYYYTEQALSSKREVIYGEDGKKIKEYTEPTVVDITKYRQPETTAQIFWLKNRQPKEWRDKRQIEQETTLKVDSEYTEEQLMKMVKDANEN